MGPSLDRSRGEPDPVSEFEQLYERFRLPVYRAIRGVVLDDERIAKRGRITGVNRDTVSEKTSRFIQEALARSEPLL